VLRSTQATRDKGGWTILPHGTSGRHLQELPALGQTFYPAEAGGRTENKRQKKF